VVRLGEDLLPVHLDQVRDQHAGRVLLHAREPRELLEQFLIREFVRRRTMCFFHADTYRAVFRPRPSAPLARREARSGFAPPAKTCQGGSGRIPGFSQPRESL
jgi:hypothetical protein